MTNTEQPVFRPLNRPVRLGYVGAGNLAQRVHLPNFASLPGCELVALAEVRRSLGEEVQRRFGIAKLYAGHRAMAADPEVDAIAVSAPFALQGEIARECLLAGKHVFMEKPMAISLAQAGRILAAAREGGARLMVAYMKRYDAGNELAHGVIQEWRRTGEHGRLLYVRAHGFCGDWLAGIDAPVARSEEPPPAAPREEHLPAWLPREYGGRYVGFLQQYTHNINLLRFLLDADDDARVAHVDLDPDGRTGVVILQVAGARCVLETGQLRYHRWDEHTQAYFERGWVHTWAPPLLLRNAVAEVEIYRSDLPEAGGAPGGLDEHGVQHTITRALPEPRWSWAYKREAEHFVESLRTGAPFCSSGEDTRTDVRLMEEIYRDWLNAQT
ncbi:MAG: Gfo/Idh/MocA family oxidoreductase [Chloroflexi bacterium]|nr:Gfo/Idh/MocA family oxidoreductase [Chloroflexota bacterium]